MVISKSDLKRRRKNSDDFIDTLSESPKRTKVHAQRKFAQSSNVSSPVITPVKEIEKAKVPETLPPAPEFLPNTPRPNTEDFLTFLCFRGTSVLPPSLSFFNTASSVSVATQSKESTSKATEKPSETPQNDRPFIAFGVRKRADPFINNKMEKKRRQAMALHTLRRKYQEQHIAKLRAHAIEKMSQGVKIKKSTIIRTRSTAKLEPPKTKAQKIKILAKKRIIQTTTVKVNVKRTLLKPKMCLRSRGRYIHRELPGPIRPKLKIPLKPAPKPKKVQDSPEQKTKTSSDFSSDDDEPLVKTLKVTKKVLPKKGILLRKDPIRITRSTPMLKRKAILKRGENLTEPKLVETKKVLTKVTKKIMRPSSSLDAQITQRPSRKTKEAASLYMNLLGPKLVTSPAVSDDDSIDSFPELPNVRKTEQRELEMKAKLSSAGRTTRRGSLIESKQFENPPNKKVLPKKTKVAPEPSKKETETPKRSPKIETKALKELKKPKVDPKKPKVDPIETKKPRLDPKESKKLAKKDDLVPKELPKRGSKIVPKEEPKVEETKKVPKVEEIKKVHKVEEIKKTPREQEEPKKKAPKEPVKPKEDPPVLKEPKKNAKASEPVKKDTKKAKGEDEPKVTKKTSEPVEEVSEKKVLRSKRIVCTQRILKEPLKEPECLKSLKKVDNFSDSDEEPLVKLKTSKKVLPKKEVKSPDSQVKTRSKKEVKPESKPFPLSDDDEKAFRGFTKTEEIISPHAILQKSISFHSESDILSPVKLLAKTSLKDLPTTSNFTPKAKKVPEKVPEKITKPEMTKKVVEKVPKPEKETPKVEPEKVEGADLICKDLGRRFGKGKVNMSTEQIEKWLNDSAKEMEQKTKEIKIELKPTPVPKLTEESKISKTPLEIQVQKAPEVPTTVELPKIESKPQPKLEPIPEPKKITPEPEKIEPNPPKVHDIEDDVPLKVLAQKFPSPDPQPQPQKPVQKSAFENLKSAFEAQRTLYEAEKQKNTEAQINLVLLKSAFVQKGVSQKGFGSSKTPFGALNQKRGLNNKAQKLLPETKTNIPSVKKEEALALKKVASKVETKVEKIEEAKPEKISPERKFIFQKRHCALKNENKSTKAFSPNNESSVYAFEDQNEFDVPLSKPFRSQFRRSSSNLTSKSEEDIVKTETNLKTEGETLDLSSETSVKVEEKDEVSLTLSPDENASASIAVQVNLDVNNDNNVSLECSTQTDASGGQVFYIPLQSTKQASLIQGVTVKLGTEGNNQRVVMHAKLVTQSPNENNKLPTISQKPLAQGIHMYPPIGTVQPTYRLKNSESGKAKVVEKTLETTPEPLKTVPSSPSASSSSSAKINLTKRVAKVKKNLIPCTPSNKSVFPSQESSGKLVEALVFRPTEAEFNDPIEFIEKIRPQAEKFGICRIIPPSTFKPECKVSDDMRFTSYNQYVHKMLQRWGPNFKELCAIKKYLATQSINLTHPPWIGGMEIDLPRLYQTVQTLGGLKEVIEKKRWPRVAEGMKIPKSAQDRVTKLDDIYCKYLLPYDTLSPNERQKLFDEVDLDWAKHESKLISEAQIDTSEDSEDYLDEIEAEECITKGRNMALNAFYRIARNTMSMYFKTPEPSSEDVETEFWKHVSDRKNHICVHSGSIDSGGWGYGFCCNKNSPFARHPWNLKILTNNSGSVLRSLGPVMGVTVPTLHVGMVFSACCWYRDPHGLPWIEYLHTGGSKIWYGVPDTYSDKFQGALKKLVPNFIQDKKTLWLPSDTAMVPPNNLVQNGVSLCKTVQEPGQFIVVFPKAFTSTICTGYCVSESVYFASKNWLLSAKNVFNDIRESCEPSMFSYERLLISIASDQRSTPEVLNQIMPDIEALIAHEKNLRAKLEKLGLTVLERLPLPDLNGKKKKKLQEDDGEYECEICRANLFVSMVTNSHEEGIYCLEHAIEYLDNKPAQLKYCKLLFTHNLKELDGLIDKIKLNIEHKSQRGQKATGKYAGMATLLK